jgi:hypothetical protein
MRDESRMRGRLGMGMLLACAMLLSLPAWAQESSPPPNTPSAAATTSPQQASEPRKKPRGRLPMYYSRVVSEKQRQDIYAIQAKYNAQIEELEKQLKAITTKRDGEVAKVLSAEQRDEVAKLLRERNERRKSRSRSNSNAGS